MKTNLYIMSSTRENLYLSIFYDSGDSNIKFNLNLLKKSSNTKTCHFHPMIPVNSNFTISQMFLAFEKFESLLY